MCRSFSVFIWADLNTANSSEGKYYPHFIPEETESQKKTHDTEAGKKKTNIYSGKNLLMPM